jgi:hypothetical protein
MLPRVNPDPCAPGEHPTTRMCLSHIWSLREQLHGWRVVDYGSGSGVLAIAALMLGAGQVGPRLRVCRGGPGIQSHSAVCHMPPGRARALEGAHGHRPNRAAAKLAPAGLPPGAHPACLPPSTEPVPANPGPARAPARHAPQAVGTDTDPLAVKAAARNAGHSGVGARFTSLQCAPDLDGPEPLAAVGGPAAGGGGSRGRACCAPAVHTPRRLPPAAAPAPAPPPRPAEAHV